MKDDGRIECMKVRDLLLRHDAYAMIIDISEETRH